MMRKRCDRCYSAHRTCVRVPEDNPKCERCIKEEAAICKVTIVRRRRRTLPFTKLEPDGSPPSLPPPLCPGCSRRDDGSSDENSESPLPSWAPEMSPGNQTDRVRNHYMAGSLAMELLADSFKAALVILRSSLPTPASLSDILIDLPQFQIAAGSPLTALGPMSGMANALDSFQRAAMSTSYGTRESEPNASTAVSMTAREHVLKTLWDLVLKTIRANTALLLDNGRNPLVPQEKPGDFETFCITFVLSQNPDTVFDDVSQELSIQMHLLTLERFLKVPPGPEGFLTANDRKEWFEVVVAGDAFSAVEDSRLPLVSEEQIAGILATPTIKAETFLSWKGPEHLPEPENEEDLFQIIWATSLAVLRMVAVAAATVPTASPLAAVSILQNLLSAIESRERWRLTTHSPSEPASLSSSPSETPPGHAFTLRNRFGEEPIALTRTDHIYWCRAVFKLFSLVNHLANWSGWSSSPADSDIQSLWRTSRDMVHTSLEKMAVLYPREVWSTSSVRQFIKTFDALPKGVGYLAQYALQSTDALELHLRLACVNNIRTALKDWAFQGGPWLQRLFQLDEALKTSALPVE